MPYNELQELLITVIYMTIIVFLFVLIWFFLRIRQDTVQNIAKLEKALPQFRLLVDSPKDPLIQLLTGAGRLLNPNLKPQNVVQTIGNGLTVAAHAMQAALNYLESNETVADKTANEALSKEKTETDKTGSSPEKLFDDLPDLPPELAKLQTELKSE